MKYKVAVTAVVTLQVEKEVEVNAATPEDAELQAEKAILEEFPEGDVDYVATSVIF